MLFFPSGIYRTGTVMMKSNVKVNGDVIGNAEPLMRAGFDLSVPVKFEP